MAPEVAAALDRAKTDLTDRFLGDPGVTGVAKGFRTRGGELTDEPVVVVMVTKKRREALVSRRRLLPRTVTVDGRDFGVDVVETGEFSFSGSTAKPATGSSDIVERMRPPLQGSSIGNVVDGSHGTLGCLVRDKTDGTICVLSANHVLANFGHASLGESTAQPSVKDGGVAASDTIATLKRFVPLVRDGDGVNTVDAAISQLAPDIELSTAVARNLMAPISPTHPAIGMAFISSKLGASFIAKIDTILSKLDVELLTPNSTARAVVGRPIEKVGRSTGYTSSIVLDTSATIVVDGYRFEDLVFAQRFSMTGDSGAVVCEGGNGRTPTPIDYVECRMLKTASTYYDLPLTGDNDLADKARDEFLGQSKTGNLLIQAMYMNLERGIARLAAAGEGTPEERAEARQYYDRYRSVIASVLADPNSTVALTQQHLDDIRRVFAGLAPELVTAAEKDAMWVLFDQVLTPALGKNRQQLIEYMDDLAVYQRVRAQLLTIPDLELDSVYSFSSDR
nr:hypothetical protein [Kibdelosporangium sp. MJ126-NF4]